MRVTSLQVIPFRFGEKRDEKSDANPISKNGERAVLLKATAIAGLGFGARLLWTLFEDGFEFETLYKMGSKIVDKNQKNVHGTKKELMKFGAWGAMMVGFIGLAAAAYTIYKTPNVLYEGNINAFRKGKDMDVYAKGNKVEKELYDQMIEASENATPEERMKLKLQYFKLKAAKNEIPDSVKGQVYKKAG